MAWPVSGSWCAQQARAPPCLPAFSARVRAWVCESVAWTSVAGMVPALGARAGCDDDGGTQDMEYNARGRDPQGPAVEVRQHLQNFQWAI